MSFKGLRTNIQYIESSRDLERDFEMHNRPQIRKQIAFAIHWRKSLIERASFVGALINTIIKF